MAGGVKTPGKVPAGGKLKKEAGASPETEKEQDKLDKAGEPGEAVAERGENEKRTARLEVSEENWTQLSVLHGPCLQGDRGERAPSLCLGGELASYDEVKVGLYIFPLQPWQGLKRNDQC